MVEPKKYFITGIGTDVGKTVASAIITEALQADYWKPVQAGELAHTDTHKVKALVTNERSVFHPEIYRLSQPMSPHAAATIDGEVIRLSDLRLPETKNHLIIEGAGGMMVPLNENELVIDMIIKFEAPVILVSRNYLGSINHTLLSLEVLRQRNIRVAGIIFNDAGNTATEDVIIAYSGAKVIGRIAHEHVWNRDVVKQYADIFAPNLM